MKKLISLIDLGDGVVDYKNGMGTLGTRLFQDYSEAGNDSFLDEPWNKDFFKTLNRPLSYNSRA